ncbi:hypothetical protein Patl1_15082 [Pistacia atlantica]|uniref:Uncharacterized protein n=1 Tax=Pistacia atlantica TaxID=434234 RepID=A0ACC1B782_9ROSI|nr:hypothetical protein Patl1_15082 [Pistacia atlantica]
MDVMTTINDGRNMMVPSFARGLNILLVDYDTTSLMYLASMLEQYSYKVATTELASVALSMINEEEGRFKLVIANVNMPDMACLSFLRVLIKKEIPVILIASERSLSATSKALDEGASFFLEKPISFDDLKYLWQHVYKSRVKPRKGNREMWSNEKMIREASDLQYSTNYQRINVDPKGKNKQVMEAGQVVRVDEKSKGTKRSLYNYEVEKRKGKKAKQDSERTNYDDMKLIKDIEKELMSDNIEELEKEMFENNTSSGQKESRRFIWTPELHLKFTAALKALENRKARPKQILKLMNVPYLTQRQVASHLQIAISLTISVSFKKYKLTQAKRNAENGASTDLPSGKRSPRIHGNSKISGQPHEKMIKPSGCQRGLRSCSIAIGFGGQCSSGSMPNLGISPTDFTIPQNHEVNAVAISTPPAAGSVNQTEASTEFDNLAKLLDEEVEEFTGYRRWSKSK